MVINGEISLPSGRTIDMSSLQQEFRRHFRPHVMQSLYLQLIEAIDDMTFDKLLDWATQQAGFQPGDEAYLFTVAVTGQASVLRREPEDVLDEIFSNAQILFN